MYKILKKQALNSTVTRMTVEAPYIAKKALAGQFIILRVDENGERIPLTVAGCCPEIGGVDIIFQVVGATTMELNEKNEGEYIEDFVGPLGTPTEVEGLKKVAVVGGGVGCAIALPIVKRLHELGAEVTSIIGFRSKEFVILEKEFKSISKEFFMTTDDGSCGEKGNVCAPLVRLLSAGERFDAVITIGPLIMMKNVAEATRSYAIKTIASMNPIMIDGTGMCGGCRVFVGGKMKFACVDGPDFDAHQIDFEGAMKRGKTYVEFERQSREKHCNLYKQGENNG